LFKKPISERPLEAERKELGPKLKSKKKNETELDSKSNKNPFCFKEK